MVVYGGIIHLNDCSVPIQFILQNNMWYVKHPFDCIVSGASAVRGGRGLHQTVVR